MIAQAAAFWAGPVGTVEGKHSGGNFLKAKTTLVTGKILAEGDVPVIIQQVDEDDTTGKLQGSFQGIGQTLFNGVRVC